MQILIFAVCDSVKAHGIKFDLMGTYDAIAIKEPPLEWPVLHFAVKAQFGVEDDGEAYSLDVRLVNADGVVINSMKIALKALPMGPEKFAISHSEYSMRDIRFPAHGEYSLDLTLPNGTTHSWPLRVFKASHINPQPIS